MGYRYKSRIFYLLSREPCLQERGTLMLSKIINFDSHYLFGQRPIRRVNIAGAAGKTEGIPVNSEVTQAAVAGPIAQVA